MGFSLLLIMTTMVIIVFIITKPKQNGLLNIFIFLCVEFLVSTIFSILLINLRIWGTPGGNVSPIDFKVYEVWTLPFLYLLFFQYFLRTNRFYKKASYIVIFILFLSSFEFFLIQMNILTHNKGGYGPSIISHLITITITFLFAKLYQSLLHKEGVHD